MLDTLFFVSLGVFVLSLVGSGLYQFYLQYKLSQKKREVFKSLRPYGQDISRRIKESGLDMQEMNLMMNLERKDLQKKLAKKMFNTKGKFADKVPKSRTSKSNPQATQAQAPKSEQQGSESE